MRRFFGSMGIGWLIVVVLGFSAQKVEASWLIDETKYHISVHGQTSCQDCHEDIAGRDLHPDPGDVGKKLSAFFQADQCLACHDDIEERLEKGFHGALRVKKPQDYGHCIQCHDPHSQFSFDPTLRERFDSGRPLREQCGLCHEERETLPSPSGSDRGCMACHAVIPLDDPKEGGEMARFCFHCHGKGETRAQKMTAKRVSPIDAGEYFSAPHRVVTCTLCHPEATEFGHDAQKAGQCSQCHLPHDEKVAHDAHILVSCESCHLGEIDPVRGMQTSMVLWKRRHHPEKGSRIHHMVRGEDKESCRRCHFPGNQVGAAAMVLPAKSILCMPCHAATFSMGDGTTIAVLILFILGGIGILSPWLTATFHGRGTAGTAVGLPVMPWTGLKHLFSSRVLIIARAMLLDVFLQRKLYRESRARWCIHSLIFLPIVFRFLWGIVALIGSLWNPGWPWVWPMLDKNFPATAFLFDLTGMMIIMGVILAFIRGSLARVQRLPGLPGQDPWGLLLVALIVVLGFVLEGMRIAMTGHPPGSFHAFMGSWISLLFSDHLGLTRIYGYMWYAHAILTGAFIVYVPFSRMLHIILAPLVLAIRGLSDHAHEKRSGRH